MLFVLVCYTWEHIDQKNKMEYRHLSRCKNVHFNKIHRINDISLDNIFTLF